jgi:hypothetical protein
MRISRWRTFLEDERAGIALEFVALLQAFLLLFFFALEIAIAVFWTGTVEKAAQLGARFAVVSDKAVTGLPATYSLAAGHIWGDDCSAGACGNAGTGFNPRSCVGGSGGDCDASNCLGAAEPCFAVIVGRMRDIAPIIQPGHVSITYAYAGLGFAGGPIIPRVTVTVAGVPYDAVMTNLLAGFTRLVTGDPGAASPLTNLPTIAVTFTGEDLATAGAS